MKRTLMILCSLLCFNNQAWSVHLGGSVTIDNIRVFDDKAIVFTSLPINTPPECETAVNTAFIVPLPLDNASVANRRLSVLLAAHGLQKIVNPNCNGCDNTTWLGNVTVCTELAIK